MRLGSLPMNIKDKFQKGWKRVICLYTSYCILQFLNLDWFTGHGIIVPLEHKHRNYVAFFCRILPSHLWRTRSGIVLNKLMLVLVGLCLHPFLFYLRLSGWSQKLSILGINRRMPKEPKLYAKDLLQELQR